MTDTTRTDQLLQTMGSKQTLRTLINEVVQQTRGIHVSGGGQPPHGEMWKDLMEKVFELEYAVEEQKPLDRPGIGDFELIKQLVGFLAAETEASCQRPCSNCDGEMYVSVHADMLPWIVCVNCNAASPIMPMQLLKVVQQIASGQGPDVRLITVE